MKILNTTWFTELGSSKPIGIVVGEDENTGEIKAYIGTASGHNEERDAKHINMNGAKLHLVIVEGILKRLKNE